MIITTDLYRQYPRSESISVAHLVEELGKLIVAKFIKNGQIARKLGDDGQV